MNLKIHLNPGWGNCKGFTIYDLRPDSYRDVNQICKSKIISYFFLKFSIFKLKFNHFKNHYEPNRRTNA